MEVKGSLIKNILDFVNLKHSNKKSEWIAAMPEKSRSIYENPILVSNWYPIKEALLDPIRATGKLFFDGDEKKAAFELGKHSAFRGLTGIYKIFIRVASPSYVLSRSSTIFQTYYNNINTSYEELSNNSAKIILTSFKENESLVFDRIIGWIYQTLMILKKTPRDIYYKLKPTNNGFVICDLFVNWE